LNEVLGPIVPKVEDREVGTEVVTAGEIAVLEKVDEETVVLETDVGETPKLEGDDGETTKLGAEDEETGTLELDEGEITMGEMGEPEIGAVGDTDETGPVTDGTVPNVCEVSG
jgi:hypothetical protein